MSNTIKTALEMWKEWYHDYAYKLPTKDQGYDQFDRWTAKCMEAYHAQFTTQKEELKEGDEPSNILERVPMNVKLSSNPADLFRWYEEEIHKLESQIATLKSEQGEQINNLLSLFNHITHEPSYPTTALLTEYINSPGYKNGKI